MEYWIFISIVDISANFKNIGIDIDKEILENVDIDIDTNIDKEILENIDIDIDIDKDILENIDIDKISNRLEFGISNRASIVRKGGRGGQPKADICWQRWGRSPVWYAKF